MRLSELQNKDIICINNGKMIGNIIDVNISDNGSLESLIVEKSKFLISRFSSSAEFEVKWKQIEKIGTDVILVKLDNLKEEL